MPKRAAIPEAVAPVDALVAPSPLSPIIAKLRTDWRWAAISQFIWTFSDAFNLPDWDIENLEADLDGDETQVLPELIAKLLFALTYNRQINRENAFENLRKTYIKRSPDTNVLGTIEEPVEWATLGLSQKVQILHDLCEWQLRNPARFRALLKTEDEESTWRVDPLGWDKAGNTYYLFDDNRLWVQRIPPAPPRSAKKTSLKAKRAERAIRKSRPPSKKSHKKKTRSLPPSASLTPPPKEEEVVDGPRKRTQVAFYGNVTPTAAALKRGASQHNTPTSTRGTRSHPNLQADAEAKPAPGSRSTPSRLRGRGSDTATKSSNTPIPRGTRVSRRLRDIDDEWQQIPDEWLGKDKSETKTVGRIPAAQTNGKAKAKKRDVDEGSELSELTDEEEHEAELQAARLREESTAQEVNESKPTNGTDGSLTPPPADSTPEPASLEQDQDETPEVDDAVEEDGSVKGEIIDGKDQNGDDEAETQSDGAVEEAEDEIDEIKLAILKSNEFPEGFVEWEAVCVTLYDWRTFPEQFAKSRDADEKALYQMLAQEVGPTIIDALVAKEQEKLKQLAVNNRKRSSRIATKELERDEILTRQRAQREMEERMTNQQREELRQAREQEEAIAQEKAREDRFREREERAAAREEAAARRMIEEQEKEEAAVQDRASRKRRRDVMSSEAGSATPNPAAVDAGDRWELACEVCRKTGWNMDEDQDLVCCDECGRWQHTECHDRADASQGRPKRKWEDVDFQCQDCRRKAARQRQKMESENANPKPPSQTVSLSVSRSPHDTVKQPLYGQQMPQTHPSYSPFGQSPHSDHRPSSREARPYPSQSPTSRPANAHLDGQLRPSPHSVPHKLPDRSPQQIRPVLPPLHHMTGMSNGHRPIPHHPQSHHQQAPGYGPPGHPMHYPPQQGSPREQERVRVQAYPPPGYPPQHGHTPSHPRPPPHMHHAPPQGQQYAHPVAHNLQPPMQYPPQHQHEPYPSSQHIPRASHQAHPPQGPPHPGQPAYPPHNGPPGRSDAWQQAPTKRHPQHSPSGFSGQPLPPQGYANYDARPPGPVYLDGQRQRPQQGVYEPGRR